MEATEVMNTVYLYAAAPFFWKQTDLHTQERKTGN